MSDVPMVEATPGDFPFQDPDEPGDWWLLNYYLEMPFYMPYLDGATFNVSLSHERWAADQPEGVPELPFVLLKLIQRKAPAPPDPTIPMRDLMLELAEHRCTPEIRTALRSGLSAPPSSRLHLASIIEAITPKILTAAESEAARPHHPTTYLERCLQAVNLWLRSLALATRRQGIRTITAENLPMFLVFFHQRPGDGTLVRHDAFRAHENPAVSPNSIATKNLAERVRRTASSVDDSHGVFKSGEWYHTAIRLGTVEGRYDLAIVALNTAFEVLVFGLARVLLVDEGVTTPDIDARLSGRMGVATVCHSFLEPRIGGRWDATDLTCAFGEATARIVEVRNTVVHEGLSISVKELHPALDSFGTFVKFVTSQVGASRWRFQRSFMDLVNTFGVLSHVVVSDRFSRAAMSTLETTPRYWLPSSDPRQGVDPDVVVYGDPGTFPPTARPEKLTEWETTHEQFMHLVVRAT